jgi:hypothetical protein
MKKKPAWAAVPHFIAHLIAILVVLPSNTLWLPSQMER